MSTESVMPSNHVILCHLLLLLPSIFPRIWVFSNESTLCIRWPKHWSFSFCISPSNEYSWMISFRIDWFDLFLLSVLFSSVTQSCPTLRDSTNRSTPDIPVHHQLPESTQTHVHWVSDAIKSSHPLLSPSPAFNISLDQDLLQWVSCSLQSCGQSKGVSASVSVLPINTQDWSPLGLTCWISMQSKGFSRVFSSSTVQEHQFFGAQLSL